MRILQFPLLILTAGMLASTGCRPRSTDDTAGAATAASGDSAFAGVQTRGRDVMGVNQYTSRHVFEDLPDGGRIVLDRDAAADSAAITTIRAHMRDIAAAFARGDFSSPSLVHAREVPGTRTMTELARAITYVAIDRPRGAEVRIRATEPEAVAAVHAFLAFQRSDHRAAGHEHGDSSSSH
jgi:hypothetical protein